jgi:hypothetical protein
VTAPAPSALPVLARAPRLANRLAGLLAAYAVAMELGAGWGLPQVALSPVGVGLGVLLVLALAAGALAALLDVQAPAGARWPAALVRGGLALLLLGLPLSLVGRTERVIPVAEDDLGQVAGLPGLSIRRFGQVQIAPAGENFLLSKAISIELEREDGSRHRVGLWPPTLLGAWRLAVLRYGFAPGIDWRDERGAVIAQGFQLLGTLPRTPAEEALVSWTPEPNVMLGVGLYPPRVEDLLTPTGSEAHLFLRLQRAALGGVPRTVADPSAYRWLADGRAAEPEWHAEVFAGSRRLFAGAVQPGVPVRYPDGSLLIVPKLRYWVELQAIWDPFLYLAAAGAGLLLVGASARTILRIRSQK